MNTKTTIAGILTIVAGLITYAVAFIAGTGMDIGHITTLITAITAGIGLIKAADATP